MPFAVATAVIAGIILIGCQAWEEFWDPPSQVNLDADAAREMLANTSIPPGFHFVRGRKWPPAMAGTARYAIRYNGPASSYRNLQSGSVSDSLAEFKETDCDKATLPWETHDLDWIGLVCPPGTTVRIARWPGRTPEDSLGISETALVLARNHDETRLIFLYAGT